MDQKKCKSCNDIKNIDYFEIKRSVCKECRKKYKTALARKYRKENPDKYNSYQRRYYKKNSAKILLRTGTYKHSNANKIQKNNIRYYLKNRDIILSVNKAYRENNVAQVRKKINRWKKIQRTINPSFKLRENISRSIRYYLKINQSSKNGISILLALSYTIQELKEHLSNKFESWMTWENWGVYDPKTWDDNNQATWKWQIDHIIPQSKLQYQTMTDDNFKKCWDLSNLRPLSAKQNFLEGIKLPKSRKL